MENDSGERTVVEITSADNEVTDSVRSVFSVYAPPFWPQKIELWFVLLEKQFELARITDDEKKFSMTLANIELRYLDQVLDIFGDLPSTRQYEWLKGELIKKFTDSDSTRMQKFIDDEKIGDRTPSQFYRDLRKLAPKSVSNDFVLAIWKNRLPENMQYVLTAVSVNEATILTRVADEMHDIRCHAERMLARNATNSEQQIRALSIIEDRLSKIEARIDALSLNNGRQPRSRSRRPGSGSSKRDQLDRLCYYHETFRDQARKCRAPCDWNQRKRDGSISRRRSPVTDRSMRISFNVNAGAKLCANPRNKQRGDSIEHQQQHEDSAEIRSALILPEIRNKRNEERAITKEETAGNKNVVRAGKKVRFSERVQVEFR
ncbi:uncharacterized protein LOC126918836 isoform X1 [Bombus affinis]|uniref:uncharacterized protein LOC126918836 isoform X1 n=1 Tax=Bombus affinis TaxID=309941 RepID=UPI0021B79CC2|nr:uncharacterized protein LOC126918836 isoform X1 [Bombus affinis]